MGSEMCIRDRYRPIKEKQKNKYSIVDYEPNEDMQELMRFAPLDVAISASVFFWTLGSELLSLTLNYLQSELKTMTSSSSTAKDIYSANNGDGIAQSMHSLKAMLPNLTKLQDTDLLSVSHISRSKNKKTKSKQTNLNNK